MLKPNNNLFLTTKIVSEIISLSLIFNTIHWHCKYILNCCIIKKAESAKRKVFYRFNFALAHTTITIITRNNKNKTNNILLPKYRRGKKYGSSDKG